MPLEVIIIIIIITLQLNSFRKTLLEIKRYGQLLPENISVRLKNTVIQLDIENESEQTYDIIDSVNEYLKSNNTLSPNYLSIQDIINSKLQVAEELISMTMSIPLYMGMLGTISGIIIGLKNLPTLDIVENQSQGIDTLFNVVALSMIASFIGLFLTIINSGLTLKKTKIKIEDSKRILLRELQHNLASYTTKEVETSLESLEKNILSFNSSFTNQLANLGTIVSNMEGVFIQGNIALQMQKEILDSIDKSKISEMTKYNVNVLKQLNDSVVHLESFNLYLKNLSGFTTNSSQLVKRTSELLERTDNFNEIAKKIDTNLDDNKQLLDYLSKHVRVLDGHKEQTTRAVADVGHAISETFKDLKEHIQNSSEAVKIFTVDETDLIKKALSESKTNLSNLEHIATIKTEILDFKISLLEVMKGMNKEFSSVNTLMSISIKQQEKIQHALTKEKPGILRSILDSIFSGRKNEVKK